MNVKAMSCRHATHKLTFTTHVTTLRDICNATEIRIRLKVGFLLLRTSSLLVKEAPSQIDL